MNNNLLDCTESIYSKIEQGVLLHQLFRPNHFKSPNRINISPENESIQVSHLSLKKFQTFKAHKHILFDRNMPMAQESWVVISGKVRVFYFDLDDSLITTKDIKDNKIDVLVTAPINKDLSYSKSFKYSSCHLTLKTTKLGIDVYVYGQKNRNP